MLSKNVIYNDRNLHLFCFIISLLLSFKGQAQENDTIVNYLNASSTGTFNKTDDFHSYLFSNSLNYSIKRKAIKANVAGKWLYGKQQNILVNNDFNNSFDLNLYKTFPDFYYWVLVNYNRVYSLKINNQVQYGAGVAYNIVSKPKFVLNLSDGIINDYSDVYVMDTNRVIYQTLRNSARLQVKIKIGERFTFSSISFLQSSLKDHNDYIIKHETMLLLKLFKWLSLSSRFTYDHVASTRKQNLYLTYGLTIDHYF